MSMLGDNRRLVALAANDVLSGAMAVSRFWQVLRDADYDDPLLEDLIDRIVHIPQRGGWFGFSAKGHDEWMAETRGLIERALAVPFDA